MHAWMALLLACGSPESTPPPEAPAVVPEKAARPMAESVVVSKVRARAMPPGTPNSGAFMTFHNGGDADAELVAARAGVSKTVELHTHVEEDGMMKMREVPEIVVPAGQDVVLKPGGLHVMFIGLKGPMEEGQTFPLTLEFSDGSTQEVDVPVKAIAVPTH